MICKCTQCGAAVIYNPEKNTLECPYCQTTFSPISSFENTREEISCDIYSCTSCGAQIVINNEETSTYCCYCGQPTIILSRMNSMYRPDSVIPFKVTKKNAVKKMRSRIKSGIFIPEEIKNIKLDQVRGIYIPFFLFDIHYHSKAFLSGEVMKSCVIQKKFYYRESECDFKNMTIWASDYLQEDQILQLEPYDMNGLKPFNATYLSGFYSDRYNVGDLELSFSAKRRAKKLFLEGLSQSIKAKEVQYVSDQSECEIRSTKYVLLPAWFLSFRYLNESYTILVNGQTGKLVGTIPYIKTKIKTFYLFLSLALTFIFTPLMILCIKFLFLGGGNIANKIKLFVCLMLCIFALFGQGLLYMNKMKINLLRTKDERVKDFTKRRQSNT